MCMDITPELRSQLKRLHFWSQAAAYVPPTKVVQKPQDRPADELLDFDFKKHSPKVDLP
jgi:hypothetical protein